MATLYVTEPGARIEKEYRRILVTNRDDERLLSVPLSQVSEVVLVGSVGVTTPALMELLEAGIGLSLISYTGRLRGRLQPTMSKNIPLRHLQYDRARDPNFCLQLSRSIVLAKLHNQRTLARRLCRYHRNLDRKRIARIDQAIKQARTAPDMDYLRGQEGIGARVYFDFFRQAVHTDWEFVKRTRRPPANPLNSLLSLGYSLLTQNMMTALEVAGLDPYDGFFHSDKYGRPALALDLEEEFRSVIVDSVVLTVTNKRVLRLSDFEILGKGSIRLKPVGMRKFLTQYNTRLQTQVHHPWAGRKLSYQKCFEVQALRLRKVIEGQEEVYQPFLTR